MNISDSAVLLSCLPRWALKDGKLDARMDWAIFFCDICAYMGISFDGVTRATSYKIFLRRGGHINRKSKYDIVSEYTSKRIFDFFAAYNNLFRILNWKKSFMVD